MSDEATDTARGGPTPDDVRTAVQESAVPEGAAMGTDLQAVKEAEATPSLIDAVVGFFRKVATPVETVEPTAPDETEQLPDMATAALIAEFSKLVLDSTQRTTEAPADHISTLTYALTADNVAQIIGAQPDRLRITLQNNDDADAVYISNRRDMATTTGGYRLAAGATVTLQYRGEIFAQAGGAAIVSMLVEYGG